MYRVSTSLLIGLLTASSLYAQTSANGSVRGVVTDEQDAVLPGVSVAAASQTVPREYVATTDTEGRYRLLEIPPADYTIVATLPGFQSREAHVTARAGVNLRHDIVLTVGAVTETIQVTRETPLLETQNAVRAVNVSGELLRAMPLSERREWFGALALAPGVTTAEWANNDKLFYVHGADSAANIVQIDGADVSPALTSGVEYIGLNTDAIDDIQIKTAGLDASAPLGLGGIINIATASGTNEVKGAAMVLT
ncbi:MAG: carboxypeptidase regulatory-like domain-containing protein, partial [Vicinamibacteraceae bacterium]